jgi:hypothetical protein
MTMIISKLMNMIKHKYKVNKIATEKIIPHYVYKQFNLVCCDYVASNAI